MIYFPERNTQASLRVSPELTRDFIDAFAEELEEVIRRHAADRKDEPEGDVEEEAEDE